MSSIAPYGSWRSPVRPELLVTQAVGLSQVVVDGETVLWNEGRPSEAGRQVLMSTAAGRDPDELLAPPWSARSTVHEYGGLCYAARRARVVFCNAADQRMWVLPGGPGEPAALTSASEPARSVRFADPTIHPSGRWVVCVRERHVGAAVTNDLVAVPLPAAHELPSGDPPPPVVLAEGHDFFAAPRPSPDGARLAWLAWDHPDMPWDGTQLLTARWDESGGLTEVRRIAGGRGESISQPRWDPSGTLHYVSDRSGWWNLYDEGGRPLAAAAAELAGADWAFGQSSFCFLADGRAVAAWFRGGRGELGLVEDGELRPVELGYRSFWSLAALGTDVVAIAGSPTRAPAVVRIDVEAASVDVLRSSRQLDLPPGCLSAPEALELPAEGGRSVHVLLYRPRNEGFSGPPGERPPLIVRCHGGPTAAASLVLDVGLQLWTSRGFAVVDVDYGGSTGYGREYRDRLAGAWGVVDVDDCVSAARQLAAMGEVDGERMVIRGASAGGYTTLAALTFRDVFAAGACLYGVGDLESLARDTHKFESRYLDGLVGPYPQAAELYRSRSPIHFVDRIRCPVILFQGLDDAIVPPSQSQSIADRLADRGVPVAYLAFEGEQHGFRRAETIVAVAKAELAFYGRALGFAPADDLPEVPIVNESALRRGG